MLRGGGYSGMSQPASSTSSYGFSPFGRRGSYLSGNRSSFKNRKLRKMAPGSRRRSITRRFDRSPVSPSTLHRTLSLEASHQRQSFKRSVSYLRDSPPQEIIDDEPLPAPPEMDSMDILRGYEDATFSLADARPPATPIPRSQDEDQCRTEIPKISELTQSEAREALLDFVTSRYCYSKGPAKEMTVTNIESICAFHYVLETFSEKRQTSWAFEPYMGGDVDGPGVGHPFKPWDVQVAPPENFRSHSTCTPVPHTQIIRTCHTCGGVGQRRCHTCTGSGWTTCYSCQGDGYKPHPVLLGENERCYHCETTGKKRCWKCSGDGMTHCRSCTGSGQIKCFIKLTVSWTNHIDEHVVDNDTVPEDKIRVVSGQTIFEEQHTRVWPVNNFPETTISMASAQLVLKHAENYLINERPVVQRQRIRIIPVYVVHYKYKGKGKHFMVYGVEKKVLSSDYPQTCCFGCSIL